MQNNFLCLLLLALSLGLSSCFNGAKENENQESETVFIDSSLPVELEENHLLIPDSLLNGPFVNRVSYMKNDYNGGFELYELNMNLFEPVVQHTDGSFCYGTLILSVKSPDSMKAVEVVRRIISRVYEVKDNKAHLLMDNGAEKPLSFEATLIYNPEEVTYQLVMNADPMQLDDMIENQLTLQ